MRYYSKITFPPYTHTPSVTVHPNQEGGHSFQKEDELLKSDKLLESDLYMQNDVYLYAIDLYNHGYYWEAHVYLEHLWNLHQRKGKIANFLKALIKLCASGVKLRLGQLDLAKGHLTTFLNEMNSNDFQSGECCGIDLSLWNDIHLEQTPALKNGLSVSLLPQIILSKK